MRRQQIDYILTKMLEAYDNVSDLNFTVGKPLQVESAGELLPVTLTPPIRELSPFQTETIALNLIDGDRRLTRALLKAGSCDISYKLAGKARFRTNIFSQQGYYSAVMRQLPSRVPTIEELKLPPAFFKMSEEKNGIILVTGATGTGKTTYLLRQIQRAAKKFSPDRIGAVSFTKAAVEEMAKRVAQEAGVDRKLAKNIRTVHSLCFELLGLNVDKVAEKLVPHFNKKFPQFNHFVL